MINAIISGIFNLILSLVNVLLYPINLVISSAIPDLSNVFTTIRQLFNYLFMYSSWVLDASLISSETISLFILLFTLKLTLPLSINAVKLAIKWYNSLKL